MQDEMAPTGLGIEIAASDERLSQRESTDIKGLSESIAESIGRAMTAPAKPPRFRYDAHSLGLTDELRAKAVAISADLMQIDDKIQAARVSAEGKIDVIENERDTIIDQLQAERDDKVMSAQAVTAALKALGVS